MRLATGTSCNTQRLISLPSNYAITGRLVANWNDKTVYDPSNIWTDGTDIYFSEWSNLGTFTYVLDKETRTWKSKTWKGEDIYGNFTWTDGENIYYSNGGTFILNGDTWEKINSSNTACNWTDGTNYYSNSKVWNKETKTFEEKIWNGLTAIYGSYIWTDGTNIYHTDNSETHVLDKETDTWVSKTWNGYSPSNGGSIWTDRTNIYYSSGETQYVLNKETDTWETKVWSIDFDFYASDIWSDGVNIYCFYNSLNMYTLLPSTATLYLMNGGSWAKVGVIS